MLGEGPIDGVVEQPDCVLDAAHAEVGVGACVDDGLDALGDGQILLLEDLALDELERPAPDPLRFRP